jgi:putative salt-induced outer membrane protein
MFNNDAKKVTIRTHFRGVARSGDVATSLRIPSMSRSMVFAVLSAASLVFIQSPQALAQWKGKGEAGAVIARGNSDADTVNLKLEMAKELDRWKHGFGIQALRATNDSDKTAERYAAFWQSDYKLDDRTYLLGGLRYEDDRFSGFDYQASATTGIGRKFIDTETTKFSGQAGVGYKRLEYALTGLVESEAIFAGELKLEHALTETTKIIDKFVVEVGSSNTFAANDLALQVKMSDSFSLAAGIGVRYNSDPPLGLKTTDTITTLNLVYGF